jgi:FKBP-type peptidyl-prolyl cis-trans isomerase
MKIKPINHQAAWALSVALSVGLVAGCGGSSESSSIAPGNENPNAAAEAAKHEPTGTPTSAAAPAANKPQTPTSGPLSKRPKVTVPSGRAPAKLVTKDLIKGHGAIAAPGDSVTVNYVGVLYHGGTEFDASWKRNEPFTFVLGKNQVIKGWDLGVAGMKVGGRRELIIPSALAYGAVARPGIPANSPLVFVVDLLGV